MVEIAGVDDADLALEMCEQIRSALTDDTHQPYVYLRGTDGQLVVVMDEGTCRVARNHQG